jgi:hypothetical protein
MLEKKKQTRGEQYAEISGRTGFCRNPREISERLRLKPGQTKRNP